MDTMQSKNYQKVINNTRYVGGTMGGSKPFGVHDLGGDKAKTQANWS